jgi:hypothetical protein
MSDSNDIANVPFVRVEFPTYVNASFEPKEDITAYELAKILPFFHGQHMTEEAFAALGSANRHLKRYD